MKINYNKALLEIERSVKTLASRSKSNLEGTELKTYEIRVPLLRKRLKEGFSFLDIENQELLSLWDYVWNNSSTFEVMSLCLYFYQGRILLDKEIKRIIKWVNKITCWQHSDDLSKIYATQVEFDPKFMLTHLDKWKKSSNLWKRRQSVVSLLEYSSKRSKVLPFKKLIQYVDKLISDNEYYVQKGVGWTLREIYNVYPKETVKYLDDNLIDISSITYSAATEKLDKKTKSKMNQKRKEFRKKRLEVFMSEKDLSEKTSCSL